LVEKCSKREKKRVERRRQ